MDPLHLLLPGEITDLTGGTLYDRRIAEGLRAAGRAVTIHGLDRSFPRPTAAALANASELLNGLPRGALTVIDGLAFGAMPELAAAHAERLRLVALVHHPLALETGLESRLAAALRASETAALRHARRVLVTSAFTARLLGDFGVSAADVRVVEPGTDPAPLRVREPGDRGPPRLVCIGSVTPRKGHLALVEALGGLGPEIRWSLDIAGSLERDQPTAGRLRERIGELGLADRVRLHGELPPADIDRLYARADLFVLASLFEGYGMAFAEALARGLPVLGTSGGAVAETVPADAGILVPPQPEIGRVPALRDALQRLLTDVELRERLAAGARRARAALPDWPSATTRFGAALADV
jgi:glycosyltransferase involved in cell wall biosynthesis